jgi:hypothetical protein
MFSRRATFIMQRKQSGQQAAEFGAALVILVVCIFLPLIDLAIIPIRYGLAQSLVGNYVRSLSLSENASQAFEKVENDEDFRAQLVKIGGVQPKNIQLQIVSTSSNGDGAQSVSDKPKGFAAEWLPDGSNCPCTYSLDLKVVCEIEPVVLLKVGGGEIPGLNAPFTVTLLGQSQWENLGRNPVSSEFYINE